MTGRTAPATTRRQRAARAAAGLRTGPLGRLLPRLAALNLVEGAMRLAAQAFLAALPLLMTVAAFAPAGLKNLLLDSLGSVLGVHGEALDDVRHVYSAGASARQSVGALGALLTLASATAFSRALQAVCERCWRLPRAPMRSAAWRWLIWLVVWLAFMLVQAPLRRGFGIGPATGLALSLAGSVLLWWWSQHLLLGGRIGWLSLLPGAVLAGAGTITLSWAGHLLLSQAMRRGFEEFGPLGPVFTLLSWLIGIFLVAIAGMALGEAVATSTWYRAAVLVPGEEKTPR
ncbi:MULTISPECIES: YhjD/YihY/BrkB family envelope integrity protein [Streptomyces]|uniref:YihY/virulence factor BrkB family protein n=1 Tax=Streptomyces spinosisporus TaxID=2927582 RepID=A0ABS9XMY7_9ACTN|nr:MULTISPECIES: YhjD/YihY/BrkB family envelope integrity protein [Streptomyces]MCI3243425.1 YihY/virulence factor BrkB family protein [Streptomyces spinosisporus]WUB40767.1 YihY/virulence factor BrkB family protein [Streptomyces sp. NBC_00588]